MVSDFDLFREEGDTACLVEFMGTGAHVNLHRGTDGLTYLHYACRVGFVSHVKVLLEHPDIDVNAVDFSDYTPIEYAFVNMHWNVAKLLLMDPRCDIYMKGDDGSASIISNIASKYRNALELLLVYRENEMTEALLDRINNRWSTFYINAPPHPLIKKFRGDRVGTLCMLRYKLKDPNKQDNAAHVFVTCLLVQDGYLRPVDPGSSCQRFFGIMTRLPTEIQMMLCNRLSGSSKAFIPSAIIAFYLKIVLKEIHNNGVAMATDKC